MDNKRLVIVMVVAMAAVFGWQLFVNYLFEKNPQWQRPGEELAATRPAQVARAPVPPVPAPPATATPGAPSATAPAVEAQPGTTATAPLTPPAPAVAGPAYRLAPTTRPAAGVEIGAGDANTFPLALALNPTGAGIDLATLKGFKDRAGTGVYTFQSPYASDPNATRPLATRWVTVNGAPVDLASAAWALESSTDRTATFVADVVGAADGAPVVRVRKAFELTDGEAPERGFTVYARHTFENLTAQPLSVRLAFNGPTFPPRELERGPDLQVLTGYEDDRIVKVIHTLAEEFQEDKAVRDLINSDKGLAMLWSGTGSTYFQALVRPEPLEQGKAVPAHVVKLDARALNPEADPQDRHVLLTFETTDLVVPPGQPLTLNTSVFLGPKSRALLNATYYDAYPRSYDETLVYATGPCAVCTFGWLIDLLVRLLAVFHFIFRDWGLAIIALVVLVRLLLHPLTKRSQVNMAQMGKMGPEIERLKKKYGDNKEELNKAMMQVYKEQGATPLWGCLPMLVQMPIWIALWQALNTTFELRQAPFLYGLTWIDDLASPDKLISWTPIRIPFIFGSISFGAINILPILLGVVFWLQMRFQPKPPAATPEQEQQQRIMQWMMPFLFPLFTYSAPSGLNLYILTSTGIGIWEMKRIRDHIKEREEAEKAGRVIVETKPTRGMKRRKDDGDDGGGGGPKTRRTGPGGGPPAPKKGGLSGWFADLQAKAEDLAKEAQRKQR